MAAKTLLLLVEGPHDLEFCARLLRPMGFSRIQRFDVLRGNHEFWLPTVPQKWPVNDDMLARHPVPVFLANKEGQSIAVVNAIGVGKLATRLGITLNILPFSPDAVGIILDADDSSSLQIRYNELLTEIKSRPEAQVTGLKWPGAPGQVNSGSPSTGIFIMPDNQTSGTLEDVLIDAGACAYPQLLASANSYVAAASKAPELSQKDLEELNKPAGRKKALVATMASILKPGKAIQVSIQDNRWLDGNTLALPSIKLVADFLKQLLA